MVRYLSQLLILLTVFAGGVAPGAPAPESASAGRVPSARELALIRQEVETLRGKKFKNDVPARSISEKELRAMVEHDITKDYPGRKLTDLEDLMAWLDFVPTNTDLLRVSGDLMVDQVAGLYDSDTKTMCLPSFNSTGQGASNDRKNPSQKKLDVFSDFEVGIIFAHEYTHALEDQYWPMDDPKEKELPPSSDRDDARSFLLEGSATRLMIEALPAESERYRPGSYFIMWNALHSWMGETIMDALLARVWKSPDTEVPGVPETLARSEAMPYSYGYSFCHKIMRDWGLDGLDYICDHPPISTDQVMHPRNCWEWRAFPVVIELPKALPDGWKRVIEDTMGEASTALLLGCQFKDLNRGLWLADGWNGDRAGLYEGPDGRRLLVWASAWDSTFEAQRFARALAQERRVAHHAVFANPSGQSLTWTSPDGRAGELRWQGRNVLLFETDQSAALSHAANWGRAVTFTDPPEKAARAAANHAYLRFNPLLSWRKDGDYEVTKALAGLLWRHDHNDVGSADKLAMGLLGEWRRTTSLNKWRLGWGLVAKHESEGRRGMTKTTLLPWGILGSHFSTPLPQDPGKILARTTVLGGLAATEKIGADGRRVLAVLPGGLLIRNTTGPGETAWHVLGTGYSRRETTGQGVATRLRLLGLPLWTIHAKGGS